MTLTKAHIAHKIADACGFMKNEAMEIVEKLLEIMKNRLASRESVNPILLMYRVLTQSSPL